jgi:hypothetical protein
MLQRAANSNLPLEYFSSTDPAPSGLWSALLGGPSGSVVTLSPDQERALASKHSHLRQDSAIINNLASSVSTSVGARILQLQQIEGQEQRISDSNAALLEDVQRIQAREPLEMEELRRKQAATTVREAPQAPTRTAALVYSCTGPRVHVTQT